MQHYCFRVANDEFDSVIERIKLAGLAYHSIPSG
jgi:hypothetical protein